MVPVWLPLAPRSQRQGVEHAYGGACQPSCCVTPMEARRQAHAWAQAAHGRHARHAVASRNAARGGAFGRREPRAQRQKRTIVSDRGWLNGDSQRSLRRFMSP